MTKQRQSLLMALEWIEAQPEPRMIMGAETMRAIREALAEQKQQPMATVTGWYGGHAVIEPVDGWIPAVGTVLYSAPKPDAMIHIGYVHPYGIEQLPIYAERGEKWNTPVSSTPFDGAIKVYVEVK